MFSWLSLQNPSFTASLDVYLDRLYQPNHRGEEPFTEVKY